MDVKVTSTGKVFYQIDNAVTALLMEAFPASFERVNPKPAPAVPAPQWGISADAGGFAHIFHKSSVGQVTRFDGPPDTAIDGFKVRRWSGEKQSYVFEGPEPPADVVEQYRQRWEPRPVLSYAGPKD